VLRESHLKGKVDLGTDGCVYFGTGGERWIARPPKARPADGVGVHCRGSRHRDARSRGSVLFVGESGSVYPAKKPLDAPGAKRPAPPSMRAPPAGKASIVAIQSARR